MDGPHRNSFVQYTVEAYWTRPIRELVENYTTFTDIKQSDSHRYTHSELIWPRCTKVNM